MGLPQLTTIHIKIQINVFKKRIKKEWSGESEEIKRTIGKVERKWERMENGNGEKEKVGRKKRWRRATGRVQIETITQFILSENPKSPFFFFFVGLGHELRTSHLQSRCSTV
jgi:hypothetical protein